MNVPITPVFVLVLLVVWVLTRPRSNHSPALGIVLTSWAKALVRREDEDEDEDEDDEDASEDDARGDQDDVSEHEWGAVGRPEPERHQSIGVMPVPKRPQPQRGPSWQVYAQHLLTQGHRRASVQREIQRIYAVPKSTFDRWCTKQKSEGL